MRYSSGAFLCASVGGVALVGATNGQKNSTVASSGFLTAMNSGIVPTQIVENTFLVQLPSTFDIENMNECESYDVDEDGKVPHEQVLGCSLFHGVATMGAYKADEDLNTRPTDTPLTGDIFDTAGIAQMILDGCFSVNLVKKMEGKTYSYSTLSTYESQVASSYNLDVSVKASYATVAATAGYQKKTNTFVQENGVNQASGGDSYSEYQFSWLKNKCVADGSFRDYMTKKAQTLFYNMMQYPDEKAYFEQWREMYGLVIPNMWYFGAYQELSSEVSFVSTEKVESSESSDAMNAAMDVSYGAFSSEVAMEMQQAFSETMETYDSSATLNVRAASNSNCQDIWDPNATGDPVAACGEELSNNILNWGTAIKVGEFTPLDFGITEAQNKSKMAYTMYEVGAKCFERTNHFVVKQRSSEKEKYLYCVKKKDDDDQGCAWIEYIDQTFRTTVKDADWEGFTNGYQAFDINDESQGWLDRGHCHNSKSEVRLVDGDENHCGSKHWGIKDHKYLCEDGKNGNNCLTDGATVVDHWSDGWVEVEEVDVHGLMVDFNGLIQLCCPPGMDC